MTTQQPILEGDYYEEGQDLGHFTINDLVNRCAHSPNVIVQARNVLDPSTLTPSNGQAWQIGGTGAGDWAGHDGEIAYYYDGWLFRTYWDGEIITDLNSGTNAAAYAAVGDNDQTPTQVLTW